MVKDEFYEFRNFLLFPPSTIKITMERERRLEKNCDSSRIESY